MALPVAHTCRALQSFLGRGVFGTDFAFARKKGPSCQSTGAPRLGYMNC
jgi:hypothetical protein